MPKPCDHDSRPVYEKLIGPIREVARSLGYAIGVHGTLKRDIDLIACPWTRESVPAKQLAEEIRKCAAAHNNGVAFMKDPEAKEEWFQNGCQPYGKPHGRMCWTYHLGGGPYIDLSVMPLIEADLLENIGKDKPNESDLPVPENGQAAG